MQSNRKTNPSDDLSKWTDINTWTPDDIPDMSGYRVLLTGANGGIGAAIALVLAQKGATIIMACRDKNKGEAVAASIKQQCPEAKLIVEQVDFNDLPSVYDLAARLIAKGEKLDLLYNNAGVIDLPLTLHDDDLDATFKKNYLSHFILTNELINLLSNYSRIIFTGSTHHQYGRVDFDDLQSIKKHHGRAPYNNSKFMLMMYCMELSRRLAGTGITCVAAHPGFSATNILTSTTGKDTNYLKQNFFKAVTNCFGQDPATGAIPLLYAGTGDRVNNGDYFGPSGFKQYRGSLQLTRCTKRVYDRQVAKELWDYSVKILNSLSPTEQSANKVCFK